MDNATYTKLSVAAIRNNKNLVISSCSKGGYTIAQQVIAEDNSKKIGMFLKGAIQIDTIEGLINLRDALNVALNTLEAE